jgi:hypothetical protein
MPERLLQRLSEAGIPEVIEVGGQDEAWRQAVDRFANGNGNGNGHGNGNGDAISAALQVDSQHLKTITFSTINETSVSGG